MGGRHGTTSNNDDTCLHLREAELGSFRREVKLASFRADGLAWFGGLHGVTLSGYRVLKAIQARSRRRSEEGPTRLPRIGRPLFLKIVGEAGSLTASPPHSSSRAATLSASATIPGAPGRWRGWITTD